MKKEIEKYWEEFKELEKSWEIFKSNIIAMAEEGPDTVKDGLVFKLSEYYKVTNQKKHSVEIQFCGTFYHISFIHFKDRGLLLHQRVLDKGSKRIIGEIWFGRGRNPKLYLSYKYSTKESIGLMFDEKNKGKSYINGSLIMNRHLQLLFQDLKATTGSPFFKGCGKPVDSTH